MSRVGQASRPARSEDVDGLDALGVTRFDLICNPQLTVTVPGLAQRWGQDRALPVAALGRLVLLLRAAVEHGLRFDPHGVTVTLRWLDVDRVRVDTWWDGCRATARVAETSGDLESTATVLDFLAEDWGFATSSSGPVHWMVLDTR